MISVKKVYIIASANRNSYYGIGTYVKNMEYYISNYAPEYMLSIIVLDSETSCFYFQDDSAFPTYHFPITNYDRRDKFYKRVLFVLKEYIPDSVCNIFIFNFPTHHALLKDLKIYFPLSKFIYVLHMQIWSFYLNGNELYLNYIINSNDLKREIESVVRRSYDSECGIYCLCDRLVSLSNNTSSILKEYYHIDTSKISLIYNALPDAYQVMSKEEKAALKSSFSYAPDEKLILYVGRIDSMKGVPATIEAFKKLVVKHPECRLLIVGEGNEMETCMQACKGFWNKIAFAGRLERSLIYQLYQIADAGIMLSMHEQCSYVAIEMLMHDIPLIATDTTGLNEMIADSPYKVHLQYTERETIIPIDEVVEKLELALFDPQDYSSRKIYLANYTMDLYCQHMKKLFDCL